MIYGTCVMHQTRNNQKQSKLPQNYIIEHTFSLTIKLDLGDFYLTLTKCPLYDCIRWITVHGSISQLNGFFLRLRLGKWEEGHGRTGYHVAYINGSIKIIHWSLNVESYLVLFLLG